MTSFDLLTALTMNPITHVWQGATIERVAFHLHRINTKYGGNVFTAVFTETHPLFEHDGRLIASTRELRGLRRTIMTSSARKFCIVPICIVDHPDTVHQIMLIVFRDVGYLFDPHGDRAVYLPPIACELERSLQMDIHIDVCRSCNGPQGIEDRVGPRGVRHGEGYCAAWCLLLVEMMIACSASPREAVRMMMYDGTTRRTSLEMRRAIASYAQQMVMFERQDGFDQWTDERWLRNIL